MKNKKKVLPKKGDLVEIYWIDTQANTLAEKETEVDVKRFISFGFFISAGPQQIKLADTLDTMEEDRFYGITAFPRGAILGFRILGKPGEFPECPE